MKHALSKVNEIPEHGSKLVDFFGRSVYLYRKNGAPKAVVNTCLHFGGPLDYQTDESKWVCQWHGAEFDADGQRTKGPAPAGSKLMYLSTRIEDDTLYYVWGE